MGIAPATLEESDRVTASIREVLMRHDWRVALTFLASPGEVDLSGLTQIPGLTVLVTRTPRQGPLTVHALTDQLESHPFGYRQPLDDAPLVDPAAIEVVFVPGVLFAEDGGRLGRGKGYFDGLLSSLHPRPYLIGATLDRRVVWKVPMTESDVYMDAITTESGFREAHAIASS
jgi:5-formyltetrahydrofolate cyclo-ligase